MPAAPSTGRALVALATLTSFVAGAARGRAEDLSDADVAAHRGNGTSAAARGAATAPRVDAGARGDATSPTISQDVALGLAATIDVSDAGSLTYRLPLLLPPGRRGFTPALAIAYDSHAGDGLLGRGAMLDGLPAIVRIPHEHAPTFQTGEDRFAIAYQGWGSPPSPGGRLVRDDSTSPPSYRTADETWSRVTPLGSCGDPAAPSPCAWDVRTPDGGRMVFGGVATAALPERDGGFGSRGVVAWGLIYAADVHGNSWSVGYHRDEAMLRPRSLEYGCRISRLPGQPWTPPTITIPIDTPPVTIPGVPAVPPVGAPGGELDDSVIVGLDPWAQPPSPSVTIPGASGTITITLGGSPPPPPPPPPADAAIACDGLHRIDFGYEPRPDPTPYPARHAHRLRDVTITSAGQRVRAYRLGYVTSPVTGRSLLDRIELTGTDGVTAAPPTTFSWAKDDSLRTAATVAAAQGATGTWRAVAGLPVTLLAGDVNGDGFDDLVRVAQGEDRRVVEYLLGGRAVESWTPRLLVDATAAPPRGEPSAGLTGAADHDWAGWQAVLADVDVDGRDDLVLGYGGFGVAALQIAYGTATGLAAPVEYAHGAKLSRVVQPTSASAWFRMRVADVNGDQADDVLLIDAFHRSVAAVLGRAGGPIEPALAAFGRNATTGYWRTEPTIADLDGDGLHDVVFTENRPPSATLAGGIRAYVVRGSRQLGLATPAELTLATAQPVGFALYQALAADLNADDVDDLVLAYTGTQRSTGRVVPFGRDVRALIGRWDLRAAASVQAYEPGLTSVPSRPDLSEARQQGAAWQHLAGDLDGDGCTDLAMVYVGAQGTLVEWARALPGCVGWGPLQQLPPAAAAPDGVANVHRVESSLLDVDDDGRDDLVLSYAGDATRGAWRGRRVVAYWGGPDGLSAGRTRVLLDERAAVPRAPGAADTWRARSVTLVPLDLDGDGRRDLALGTHDGLRVVRAPAGTADVVTTIANGHGASTTVTHAPAPHVAGAISVSPVACAAECGLPNRAPRPLVTRTMSGNGLGLVESHAYAYRDGRYYPGPVASRPDLVVPRLPRADLAFATRTQTHEQLETTRVTTYRQDRPFHRQVAQVDVLEPVASGWQRPAGPLLTERTTFDYALRTHALAGGSTVEVLLREQRVARYEATLDAGARWSTFEHGPYGAVTRATDCAAARPWLTSTWDCVVTEHAHVHDPARWVLNRPVATKQQPLGVDRVLTWDVTRWTGDLPTGRDRLLCDDAEDCPCFADAQQCVVRGKGRWVPVERATAHDPWGQPTAIEDALGRTTHVAYDPTFHTFPWQQRRDVDSGGRTISLVTTTTHDHAGRPWVVTEPSGAVTVYEHDPLGRLRSVVHPDGGAVAYEHLLFGVVGAQRVRRTTTVAPGEHHVAEDWFDGHGQVWRRTTTAPGGGEVETRREARVVPRTATAAGERRVLVSEPFAAGASLAGVVWTEVALDGLGRPLRLARVRGEPAAATTLGAIARMARVGALEVTSTNRAELGDDGALLGAADWITTSRELDGRGRVVRINGEHGTTTDYDHDAAGRITGAWGPYTGAGPATQFSAWLYDSFGRVRVEDDSARGAARIDYDDVGNVVARTDALGQVTTWAYDDADRVRSRVTSDGTDWFTYDPAIPYGVGRPGAAGGAWGVDHVLAYDGLGRAVRWARKLDGLGELTFAAGYDLVGRRRALTLPDGVELGWRFGAAGELLEVTRDGATVASYHDHDLRGAAGTRVTPAATTSYGRDALGRLRRVDATSSGGDELLALEYGYDGHGNVLFVDDLRARTTIGQVDTAMTWRFTYDRLDRLEAAEDASGRVTSFDHDPTGALTRAGFTEYTPGGRELRVAHHEPATVIGCVGAPQAGCVATPAVWYPLYTIELDDAGRMTRLTSPAGADRGFRYDALDRLVEVDDGGRPVTEHAYDHAGQRTRRRDHHADGVTTTWFVDPAFELQQTDGDPRTLVATHRVLAERDLIATFTRSALDGTSPVDEAAADVGDVLVGSPVAGHGKGTLYHLADHVGSVAVVTDERGDTLARYVHAPYGAVDRARSTGRDLVTTGFTGHEVDAASDLVYMGARHYAPWLGRFLTPDSVLPEGGSPRGLNRYAYAFGNPVTFVDPDGHEPKPFSPEPTGIPNETYRMDLVDLPLTDAKGNEWTEPGIGKTNRQIVAALLAPPKVGPLDRFRAWMGGSKPTVKGAVELGGASVGVNNEGERSTSLGVGPFTLEVTSKDGRPALGVDLGVEKGGEVGGVEVKAAAKVGAKATFNPEQGGGDVDTQAKVSVAARLGLLVFEVEQAWDLWRGTWKPRHMGEYFERIEQETRPSSP